MIQKRTAKDNIFSSIRPPPEDRRCFMDAHPEYGSPGSPGRSRCSGAGGPRPGCGPPPGSGPEWAGCRSPPLRGYGRTQARQTGAGQNLPEAGPLAEPGPPPAPVWARSEAGVQALGGKAGAVSPHPPVIIVPGISVIGPAVGIGHRRRPVISQQMFHARSPPSHRSMSGEARRCLGRNETSPAI